MKNRVLKTALIGLTVLLTQSMCTKESMECFRFPDLDNQVQYRDGFVLSYNENHEQPNWVFYVMKPSDLICDTKAKRNDNFKEDKGIQTGSATLDDYKGSGYDRGHLKASADESCDQEQMDETFLMSNMSPQKPGFNRGVWKNLESYVRELAEVNDSIYVYTAGVLNNPIDTIGDNNVTVPASYYKIIHVFKGGYSKTYAYLLPNDKTSNPFDDFITTVGEIEVQTGISFPNPHDSYRFPKFYCN